jgi:sugar phosphate isomerase/epimerase
MLTSGAALLSGLGRRVAGAASNKLKVTIFSKHLQFLQGEELAQGAAEIGFEGIDLTVRRGGHVEPERVKKDLPPLVAAIRRRGLEVPMITTDIVYADSPHAEAILQTMSELGIPNYRWGGFRYAADRPIARQLDDFIPQVAKLAELNGRYKVCAMYHTHSGVDLVGASIWDLHVLLSGFDPRFVGVNYDIGHATIEGGVGGWISSFRVTGPYLRGVAIKDFIWERDAKGNWRTQWKPLGEGMVHFAQFFPMLAEAHFSGPLQLHFEYPLRREEVSPAMKRDLQKLREWLAEAGLAGTGGRV